MNYYILTGSSKGLGAAIARKLCTDTNYLFCISRNKNSELIDLAGKNHCQIEYFEYDLSSVEGITELVKQIFTNIKLSEAETICLINNAGILHPIKPIGNCSSSDIINSFQINSIAPMLLTSEFISKTDGFMGNRIIINISSGAGKSPYYGWGCYCSSKAAIDMYTRCIGIEQVNKENPVKIISFSPGIIDTDMQRQIRESEIADFEQVERFRKFKEDGVLKEPDFVAEKVIELINNPKISSGTLIDLKALIALK